MSMWGCPGHKISACACTISSDDIAYDHVNAVLNAPLPYGLPLTINPDTDIPGLSPYMMLPREAAKGS